MPTRTGCVFHVADCLGADDDAKVANCITKIKLQVPRWLTATMIFESGAWNFSNPIIINRQIALTSSGYGMGSCLLAWDKGVENYGKCIHYVTPNRAGISNLALLLNTSASDGDVNNVTMLHVEDCGRNTFENLWIAPGRNNGVNNIGIYHTRGDGRSGRGESNWFQNLNIVAPRPIVIYNGDNNHFINADIGIYRESGDAGVTDDKVSAGIHFIRPAFNASFANMSFQKGDHLLHCHYDTGTAWGNQLTLKDIRYEQQNDYAKPGIYYHTRRTTGAFGQEMLTLINPRMSHTPQPNVATDVDGVHKYTIVGGWFFGPDGHIGQQPKTMWDLPKVEWS